MTPETHRFADDGAIPNSGDPGEHAEVLANIAAVALPQTAPVQGRDGPLVELWR